VASIDGFIPSLATCQCTSIFVIIVLFVYLPNKFFFLFFYFYDCLFAYLLTPANICIRSRFVHFAGSKLRFVLLHVSVASNM